MARKQKRLLAAYKSVFNGSEDANLVLMDILKATNLFDIYGGNNFDNLPHFEGQRSIGYYINSQINPTQDELKLLEAEIRQEHEQDVEDDNYIDNN